MRTVEDDAGDRLLLLATDGDEATVLDPTTGRRESRPRDALARVEAAPPLATAATTVSAPVRALVGGVPDERALGLLVELDRRGPTAARTLLDATDLCESDLHGRLTSLRAADLVARSEVDGRQGYELTPRAREVLAAVRD